MPARYTDRVNARAASRLAFLALALTLASCGKPLLSARDERSQYDRYDRVRNEFAPQYLEDPYGRRVPNLRSRLRPHE
jgi:hypothetical protein